MCCVAGLTGLWIRSGGKMQGYLIGLVLAGLLAVGTFFFGEHVGKDAQRVIQDQIVAGYASAAIKAQAAVTKSEEDANARIATITNDYTAKQTSDKAAADAVAASLRSGNRVLRVQLAAATSSVGAQGAAAVGAGGTAVTTAALPGSISDNLNRYCVDGFNALLDQAGLIRSEYDSAVIEVNGDSK
jgi:hypothetical protein